MRSLMCDCPIPSFQKMDPKITADAKFATTFHQGGNQRRQTRHDTTTVASLRPCRSEAVQKLLRGLAHLEMIFECGQDAVPPARCPSHTTGLLTLNVLAHSP